MSELVLLCLVILILVLCILSMTVIAPVWIMLICIDDEPWAREYGLSKRQLQILATTTTFFYVLGVALSIVINSNGGVFK